MKRFLLAAVLLFTSPVQAREFTVCDLHYNNLIHSYIVTAAIANTNGPGFFESDAYIANAANMGTAIGGIITSCSDSNAVLEQARETPEYLESIRSTLGR